MKYVPKPVTRLLGRTVLKLNQHSPTILVVTGVVGFGATAVLAAKAAKRTDPVIEQHQKSRIQINETAMSQDQERKQVFGLYTETTLELGKIYAPTILLGTASAASILYGHKILQGRHVASLMAFSGLQEQFLKYRDRVAQTLGAQAESDIYNGAHGVYVEDPDHKGEYKLQPVWDDNLGGADYLRPWFDEENLNCTKDPQQNYLFLCGIQSHMKDNLQGRGYLFLNEVYKALGMPLVPEGQVAGWLYNGDGDGFVDFGFMTNQDPHTRAFMSGEARTVQLSFNVDGNIYEKMLDRGAKRF